MKSMAKILTIILVSVLTLSLIPIAADNPVSANPTGGAWTKYTGELNMGGMKAVADSGVIKDGTTYIIALYLCLLKYTPIALGAGR